MILFDNSRKFDTMHSCKIISILFCIGVLYTITVQIHGEDQTENYETKCQRLYNPEMAKKIDCCHTVQIVYPKKHGCEEPEDSNDEWECASYDCVLKKYSLTSEDGSLNQSKFHDLLSMMLEKLPNLAMIAKRFEKCLEGNYLNYGPEDVCNSSKIFTCLKTNVLLDCPEWEESETCSDFKNLTLECKDYFDEMLTNVSFEE